MTSYRYLGYGVTDSNGVAHLDHDPSGNPINGYTGTGAGEIDFIASLDNPMTSGSIVSETFNVYDAWMRDGGVTGDVNNDDWLVQTGGSRTVGSDGTVFSGDTGTLFAWINKHGTTHSGLTDIAEYSGDYGIELTVVEVNGSARCSIYEAYPSPKRVDIPLSVGKWRITRINNVVTAYKDGVLTPITSLSLTAPQRIGIIALQGDSVKLRDIAVYGLGGTELGLTASKQIIESGETITLSAYLSEGSGNTVQLYNADTDTLIDTMTDAGNGQYTYTFTGTGSGQKTFYAKYGSVVSEPYPVIDCIRKGTETSWWDTSNGTLSIPTGADYCEFVETTEYAQCKLKSANAIPKDCVVELDYYQVDGLNTRLAFVYRDSSNNWLGGVTLGNCGLSVGEWNHIKLQLKNGQLTVTNTTNTNVYTPSAFSISTDNVIFGFQTNNETTKIRFKNVEMYPI